MRASRLLSILILLQLRPQITAPALAREFEVSVRTILRDIDELSAAGVPVYAERGRGGGFKLREGFATRLNGLLGDEAQALPLLGLPGAASELGLGGASQRLKLKLQSALPGESAALAGRLQARLHVDPLDWYQGGAPTPHLPALASAVLEGKRVEIDYLSWKGERRWKAEPLGLVLKAGAWYGVMRSGQRVMMLKVANIQALTVGDESFERPADFELADWWQASTQRFERELRPEMALLRLTPEGCRRLSEKGRYAAQAVAVAVPEAPVKAQRWVRVKLPIESLEQAARLVLSLAPEAQALEPTALREQIGTWARQLAGAHKA
ncbi:putative DNA-binding transcriptional regulator YafY [Pelomonas saccharophila]|uniref:DNA-binding transcriptional regulator YafY n=1 Tax=Roseateles saccharophilus TaxID=304 RepID=A0ABU1YMU9_ROSSA|nr:WYL domain-containing protein [Roseateles saccharophilus]MDR7270180.1 putative DNA-binding transcriptional regulator YafY [Roseateles saccharophilus]